MFCSKQSFSQKVSPSAEGETFSRIIFLLFLFPLLISPVSAAASDNLAVVTPEGQSITFAQTNRDTVGSCHQGLGRAFILNWSPSFNLEGDVSISGLALFLATRLDLYGPLNIDDFRLTLKKGG